MDTKTLSAEELQEVSGGTFTPNTYSESGYHEFGISTRYHFFDKDEFKFMGRNISYERANEIMKLGNMVKSSVNSGFDHKNKIGSHEPAFVRAFNLQLSLNFGADYVWDGKPGISF